MEHWTKEEKNQILRDSDELRLSKLHDQIKQSRWRTQFHIQTVTGLMNDPNGFSYFHNEWHVFYQWFPFGAIHGMKHWYHVSSKDLVHWQNKGLAMKPDLQFDNYGCYSGSAYPTEDYLYLLYTGNHNEPNGQRVPYQMISAMSAEGKITKLKHPIIEPRDGYTEHQRDPKIFHENGYYWILLGAQDEHLKGKFLLYKSKQIAMNWEFAGELKVEGYDSFGYMVECPDLEKIGDQWVLFFSPQGLTAVGDEMRNAYQNVYMIGELNLDTLTFKPNGPYRELDRGFDFYAAQCAHQKQTKNAILMGWFGCSDYTYPATDEEGWAGLQTLPRELSIENGKLIQKPIKMEEYKGEEIFVAKKGSIVKDRMHGRTPEACILHLENVDCNGFEIGLFTQELKKGFSMVYDERHHTFTIDRGDLENQCNTAYGTDRKIRIAEGVKKLDVFVDHSTVEIFINDGEYVMSSRIFPKPNEHLIRMRGKDLDLTIWSAQKTIEDDFVL